jgi:hypothetical protein
VLYQPEKIDENPLHVRRDYVLTEYRHAGASARKNKTRSDGLWVDDL